jgi:hypothetical protein
LRGARSVSVEIDGRVVEQSRVRVRRDKVIVAGSLEELGLAAGRESVLRLVVDGVPVPSAAFVP